MKEKGRARPVAASRARSSGRTNQILSDYERGVNWVGWLLFASFALMGLGSVIFGW